MIEAIMIEAIMIEAHSAWPKPAVDNSSVGVLFTTLA